MIQEKGNQILEKKIWAKWESGLTAVWLKRDPPVLKYWLKFKKVRNHKHKDILNTIYYIL